MYFSRWSVRLGSRNEMQRAVAVLRQMSSDEKELYEIEPGVLEWLFE